jgi:hypothetical protein
MSLDILAHMSITQRAHHVLYKLLAVRFTAVCLSGPLCPGCMTMMELARRSYRFSRGWTGSGTLNPIHFKAEGNQALLATSFDPEIQLPDINNQTTNESVEGAFRGIGMRLRCPAIWSLHNSCRRSRKLALAFCRASPAARRRCDQRSFASRSRASRRHQLAWNHAQSYALRRCGPPRECEISPLLQHPQFPESLDRRKT